MSGEGSEPGGSDRASTPQSNARAQVEYSLPRRA